MGESRYRHLVEFMVYPCSAASGHPCQHCGAVSADYTTHFRQTVLDEHTETQATLTTVYRVLCLTCAEQQRQEARGHGLRLQAKGIPVDMKLMEVVS